MDDYSENKKAKGMEICVLKGRVMFGNYKDALSHNKMII